MSIDLHLAGFPTLNQNHEPANPYPDINSGMDCVPTSVAAALTWFTKQQYFGDQIIDAVYGSNYTGGTAASNYVDYCAARGVKLYSVGAKPDTLVWYIHQLIHAEQPILVTVPGQWNNPDISGANPGPVTHVMVVTGDGPGLIEVMNPWNGDFEVYSDAWFALKLCYGQIWPMEGVAMVPEGPFYTVEAGKNGVPASGNAVAAAVGLTWPDILAIPGQPANLKDYDPAGPNLVGPGTYGVSFLLPGFPPPVPDTSAKDAEIASLQAEVAKLEAQPPAPPPVDLAPVLATLQDVVRRLEALPPIARSGGEVPAPAAPVAPVVASPVQAPEATPEVPAAPSDVVVPGDGTIPGNASKTAIAELVGLGIDELHKLNPFLVEVGDTIVGALRGLEIRVR